MAACFNQSLLPWVWCLPVFWMKHSVCVCVSAINHNERTDDIDFVAEDNTARKRTTPSHCRQCGPRISRWIIPTTTVTHCIIPAVAASTSQWTNEYLFYQHRYDTVKTEVCQLDRKAQKSTYNCPKRYVNEEIHYNNTHPIQLQHCNNPSTTQLQASTSHQPIAGNVVRKSVTGSHLQFVNTATIKR